MFVFNCKSSREIEEKLLGFKLILRPLNSEITQGQKQPILGVINNSLVGMNNCGVYFTGRVKHSERAAPLSITVTLWLTLVLTLQEK